MALNLLKLIMCLGYKQWNLSGLRKLAKLAGLTHSFSTLAQQQNTDDKKSQELSFPLIPIAKGL